MRARIDVDLCDGCGVCEQVAEEVFELNDDGVAEVILDPVPPEHEDAVREAAESCPTEAIILEED